MDVNNPSNIGAAIPEEILLNINQINLNNIQTERAGRHLMKLDKNP